MENLENTAVVENENTDPATEFTQTEEVNTETTPEVNDNIEDTSAPADYVKKDDEEDDKPADNEGENDPDDDPDDDKDDDNDNCTTFWALVLHPSLYPHPCHKTLQFLSQKGGGVFPTLTLGSTTCLALVNEILASLKQTET